jgi:hypothetical protein
MKTTLETRGQFRHEDVRSNFGWLSGGQLVRYILRVFNDALSASLETSVTGSSLETSEGENYTRNECKKLHLKRV